VEPAQAAGQYATAGLPLRRGPLEERLLGPGLADRPDPAASGHRRGAVLVGLRAVRSPVPRRGQAHPRADRRGAQARGQLRREDEAGDVERGARAGPQGRGPGEPRRHRGRPQHWREYGRPQELPPPRREVHDPHPQVQHALVIIPWIKGLFALDSLMTPIPETFLLAFFPPPLRWDIEISHELGDLGFFPPTPPPPPPPPPPPAPPNSPLIYY
jgi:hypothetical protein